MDIKRCPFCGRTAHVEKEDRHYRVVCLGIVCRAQTSSKDSKEEAVAAWNKRAMGE